MEAIDIIRGRIIEEAELSAAAAIERKEALIVGFYEKLDQLVEAIKRSRFKRCIVYEWAHEEYVGIELYSHSETESQSLEGFPLQLIIDADNNYEVVMDSRFRSYGERELASMFHSGQINVISGDIFDPWIFEDTNMYGVLSMHLSYNTRRLDKLLEYYDWIKNKETN